MELSDKIKNTTEKAQKTGALQPIATEYDIIEQKGIPFIVRIISNLARKDEAQKKQESKKEKTGKEFEPYEPDLFVTDISETHLCLLNKYNVVDNHVLIVTRKFEEQENLINQQDFTALWKVMSQYEGLAFYNAGKKAGASVRHKHLQIIPLPLVKEGAKNIPIEAVINPELLTDKVTNITALPFTHGIIKIEGELSLLERYNQLRNQLEISSGKPYNLLITKKWMLMIPRSLEKYQSIAINSLGFAGALLVRNQEQLELVKKEKPLTILEGVAG